MQDLHRGQDEGGVRWGACSEYILQDGKIESDLTTESGRIDAVI